MANQLKSFNKKFIAKKDAKALPEEEYIKLLKFNIDEFDYTPTEEEMSALGVELEEKKLVKAVFGSFPYGLRIAMKTAGKGKPGKEISFSNGKYTTSNSDEIKFLKEKAKHPYPGQIITLVDEIYEGE